MMHCRLGDKLAQGQPLATLYTSDPAKLPLATDIFRDAVTIGPVPVARPQLILGTVTAPRRASCLKDIILRPSAGMAGFFCLPIFRPYRVMLTITP
jgi:hypothetical protein